MSKNYSSIGTERAISPVVGVMLMLVVVIIIAAAVSAYSGNLLAGIGKKAPTLSMDVKVVQTGDWHGSGFFATVTSVSEPIRTKDLRIVTSWTGKVQHVEGSSAYTSTTVSDGNTVVPGIKNINTLFNPANTATELPSGLYVAPFGSGPGVNGTESLGNSSTLSYTAPSQQFGNYTLVQGTVMSAQPCGANSSYDIGSSGLSAASGYGIYSPRVTHWSDYWCYSNADGSSTLLPCDESQGKVLYCEGGMWGSLNGVDYLSGAWYCDYDVGGDCDGGSYDDHVNNPAAAPCKSLATDGLHGLNVIDSYGYGSLYSYSSCDSFSQSCSDPTRAVLGTNWSYLKWGDTVNVKVIFTPTGTVIFNKNVEVTEG